MLIVGFLGGPSLFCCFCLVFFVFFFLYNFPTRIIYYGRFLLDDSSWYLDGVENFFVNIFLI